MADLGANAPVDVSGHGRSGGKHSVPEAADATITINVDTTSSAGRTLVSVAGELDMLTAPQLRGTLLGCLETPGADVLVDLDLVDFLASTGLGVLVEAMQHGEGSGGSVRIICSNRTVLRPLELTGLDQVFTIFPSLAHVE
jgi:anti-sigma B factor antagonist